MDARCETGHPVHKPLSLNAGRCKKGGTALNSPPKASRARPAVESKIGVEEEGGAAFLATKSN